MLLSCLIVSPLLRGQSLTLCQIAIKKRVAIKPLLHCNCGNQTNEGRPVHSGAWCTKTPSPRSAPQPYGSTNKHIRGSSVIRALGQWDILSYLCVFSLITLTDYLQETFALGSLFTHQQLLTPRINSRNAESEVPVVCRMASYFMSAHRW